MIEVCSLRMLQTLDMHRENKTLISYVLSNLRLRKDFTSQEESIRRYKLLAILEDQ